MRLLAAAALLLVANGVFAVPPFVPRSLEEAPTPDELLEDDVMFRGRRSSQKTMAQQAKDALNGKLYKEHRWPNRTLYFFIDDSLYKQNSVSETLRKLNILVKGLNRISKNTCINFVEDRNQKLRIRVFEKEFFAAGQVNYVGVDEKGSDHWIKMNPGYWQETGKTFIHETIHALGFTHVQERIDSGDHLHLEEDAFQTVRKSTYGFVPYDLGSIMHYDLPDQIKDPKYKHTWHSHFPTFLDIKALNMLYDCQEYCPDETSAKCQNGGYPNPRDCSKCNCPLGYGGPVCDQRPKGCGEVLNATDSWQSFKWTVRSNEDVEAHLHSEYQELYTVFCTHWIQAPPDRKIEIKLEPISDTAIRAKGCFHKKGGRLEDGVEIKILPDPTLTNPRYCMNVADEMEIQKSALNPTPVISWTGKEDKEFQITFRHVPEEN